MYKWSTLLLLLSVTMQVLKIVNFSILSIAAAALHTQHVHYWQSVCKSHSTAPIPVAKKGRNGTFEAC
jgi:hypothetical protein